VFSVDCTVPDIKCSNI